jgi:hypothetical protein
MPGEGRGCDLLRAGTWAGSESFIFPVFRLSNVSIGELTISKNQLESMTWVDTIAGG